MKPHIASLALVLVAGCSEDGGDPPAPPIVASAPTPSPTPPPAPSPTPSPAPSPTPAATPASYSKFSDLYIFRMGAGVTLPSACGGFALLGRPPTVLPVSAYGRGLSFRFVVTPGVWAIGGEVAVGFDGRDGVAPAPGQDVAYVKDVAGEIVRFSVARPAPGGTGLDYARLAAVSAPVQGVSRLYQCVIGIPTLPAELTASASGAFGRNVVMATAHVGGGATVRTYSLDRSPVSISADLAARQLAISITLVGTPIEGSGPDIQLGSITASAPIDPANGTFVANLTGNRAVTGSISGRFFGPEAVEIGAAIGASAPETGDAPAFSLAGGVYGAR